MSMDYLDGLKDGKKKASRFWRAKITKETKKYHDQLEKNKITELNKRGLIWLGAKELSLRLLKKEEKK